MEYNSNMLGWKLWGLYNFSKLGLFNRDLIILDKNFSKDQIINALKNSGFKDNEQVAIRFSKENAMGLPYFLGKYTLDNIADIILKEKKDYVPFVHKLVKTKFSMSLYYDGNTIFLELWPGLDGSKTKALNENSDLIIIKDNQATIGKYLKLRSMMDIKEDLKEKETLYEPHTFDFLKSIAKKINLKKQHLTDLLKIQNPFLCDINCESINDINFMGMQKTDKINIVKFENILNSDFHIIRNFADFETYDSKKNIFLDIPLNRELNELNKIIEKLKNFPEVYLKSVTMHLAVVLREFGINVKHGFLNEDYEIKNFSL